MINYRKAEKKSNAWNLFYYMSKKSKDSNYSKSSLVSRYFSITSGKTI